jgi:hypothetical protein
MQNDEDFVDVILLHISITVKIKPKKIGRTVTALFKIFTVFVLSLCQS